MLIALPPDTNVNKNLHRLNDYYFVLKKCFCVSRIKNELLAKRKRKEIQTLTSSMNLVSSLDEPAFRQSTLF